MDNWKGRQKRRDSTHKCQSVTFSSVGAASSILGLSTFHREISPSLLSKSASRWERSRFVFNLVCFAYATPGGHGQKTHMHWKLLQ